VKIWVQYQLCNRGSQRALTAAMGSVLAMVPEKPSVTSQSAYGVDSLLDMSLSFLSLAGSAYGTTVVIYQHMTVGGNDRWEAAVDALKSPRRISFLEAMMDSEGVGSVISENQPRS
jgi:hypothetical protein